MKAAFLDRDGTIVSDYPDEHWTFVTEPEFLPGAITGLKQIQSQGFALIIVTNQYLINERHITQLQYDEFSRKMAAELVRAGISLLDIFYCPHARSERCSCCKPRPGMIEQALRKYPAISLRQSFLAGDSASDMELARTVGLRSFSVGFDFDDPQCRRVESLADIARYL